MIYNQTCCTQFPWYSIRRIYLELSRDACKPIFMGFLVLFLSCLPLATAVALTIERVSTDSNGGQTGGGGIPAGVSSDGNIIVFNSEARDLVPEVSNNGSIDVYLKDRLTNATTRISTDRSGIGSNSFSIGLLAMTPDGRYVVFESSATNLVPSGSNGAQHIFLKDTATGETTVVSADSNGVEGNGPSSGPDISDDGRYIVFESIADNLVAVNDTDINANIYFKDMLTGVISRITNDINGQEIKSDGTLPTISGDGRFVAFIAHAGNWDESDITVETDVVLKDMSSGTVTLVSTDSLGDQSGEGFFTFPAINSDGRYVTFLESQSKLVIGSTGQDILLKDTLTGATTLVSTNSGGAAGGAAIAPHSISGDGRYVAFQSGGLNLVPDHLGEADDIFVKDTVTNATALVSTDSAGAQGLFQSEWPVISANGQYVAFQSHAPNLVADDTNDQLDVFVVTNPLFVPSNDVDTDNDGVIDIEDNCTLIPNGPTLPDAGGNSQLDTDGDGFGNSCDADLDNDGLVNSLDLGLFKAVLLTADPDADLNGDGIVNSLDLGIFKPTFLNPPGPSGLVP